MKWIKRLLAAAGVLVLIFVVAAVVLALTFDPNDYKQQIAQAVEDATGRSLTLAGDIELSFFPWLGVELGKVRLSNAQGFGDEAFARVADAHVSVKVLPLFTGRIEAGTVRLKDLELNLSKNARGETNWADLMTEPAAEPAAEPQEPGTTELAIDGIRLANAALHWRDAEAGTDLRIAPVNLTTGEVELGEPFDVDLTAKLQSRSPPLEADVALAGEITLDPNAQRYRLAELELAVQAVGESLPGGKLEATLTTTAVADLAAGTATVEPLTLRGPLTLEGQIKASQLNQDTPKAQGELHSEQFDPRALMKTLGMEPPATSDPDVLQTAKLDVAYQASADSATLSQISARLDETEITGEGSIQSFAEPKITFKVALDAIDLDRYTPPEPEGAPGEASEPASEPAPPSDDNLDLPVDTLRGLNVNGSLTAGKLKVSNLRFNDTRATLTAKDGLVQLKPFGTALYEGRIDGAASLDARGETPVLGAQSELKGVEIGPLSVDLLGQEQAYVRGASKLNFDLNTHGSRISALKKRLAGNFSFAVDDGALRDEELARTVEKVVAFLKGREPAEPGKELIFDTLSGSALIEKGVARNDDLTLLTPLIAATGQGRVDIGQSTIDYKLGIGLPGSLDNGGRQVPLKVSGPLEDPNYSVDLAGLIGKEQKQKLEQKKQELEEQLKEKKDETLKGLEDKVKDKLQDKFKF